MPIFYEVRAEGVSRFYPEREVAMYAAEDLAVNEQIVTVDRIKTNELCKKLLMRVMNGEKYVEDRKRLAYFQNGFIKK